MKTSLFLVLFFIATLALFRSSSAATFNISNGDVAGLANAINIANGNGQHDEIHLAAGGTYILTSALPAIGSDKVGNNDHFCAIIGNGATIMRSSSPGTPSFAILTYQTISPSGSINNVQNVTFSNGAGGILFGGGYLSVFNCTFSGCSALAIHDSPDPGSTLYVTSCTFLNNSNGSIGAFGDNSIYVSNCTFVNDGTWAVNNSSAFISVASCTFSENNGAIYMQAASGSVGITNTILKSGSPVANLGNASGAGGRIHSYGYNLSSDNGAGYLTNTRDQINTDPLLDPNGLQNNGGPTQTIRLLSGSPAIDQGYSYSPGENITLTTDQRGWPRPSDNSSIPNATGGDGSDIGAVEMDLRQSGTLIVNTTVDDHDDGVCGLFDCTLREAVEAANNDTAPNAIGFTNGLTGTITLQPGLGGLAINDSTTITGPGARLLAVSGGNATRIFSFGSGTTCAVSGLTIMNGSVTSTVAKGAGISNQGTLTVTDCTISGNSVQGTAAVLVGSGGSGQGGAVYNSGVLTLSHCTLSGNRAGGGNGAAAGLSNAGAGGGGNGGAIFNDTGGTLALTNCTLNGNTGTGGNGGNGGGSRPAGANGGAGRGGIFNQGAMMVTACTVSGNTGTGGFGGSGSPNGAQGSGSGGLTNTGTAVVGDTISAANSGNNGGADVDGAFNSNSYNLIGSGTHSTGFSNGTNHDQVGSDASPINPHLQALQNNGGPTDTMALFSISLAVNNGDPNAPTQDQRYYLRSGLPDIGAFEYAGTLAPASIVSRKTHGSVATPFDVNLPVTGNVGIECRSGGVTNDYQLVVAFATPITLSGNPKAQVTSGSAQIGVGGTANANLVSVSGGLVTVPLTNVSNAQKIVVTLSGASDGITTNNVPVTMGILIGDTTGNGTVNASDVSLTKLKSGQAVDASNFREDVTVSGSINASDVSSVKLKSGTALPPAIQSLHSASPPWINVK
jgi:CSLREA domain-containing protein